MSKITPKIAGIEMFPMPEPGEVPKEDLYVYNASKNSFEFVVCIELLDHPELGVRWQPLSPQERYCEQELRCFYTHFLPKHKVDEMSCSQFGHQLMPVPTEFYGPVKMLVSGMIGKLIKYRHKKHWSKLSLEDLFCQLEDEYDELADVLDDNLAEIKEVCADIANLAMMIADNAARLQENKEATNE